MPQGVGNLNTVYIWFYSFISTPYVTSIFQGLMLEMVRMNRSL